MQEVIDGGGDSARPGHLRLECAVRIATRKVVGERCRTRDGPYITLRKVDMGQNPLEYGLSDIEKDEIPIDL